MNLTKVTFDKVNSLNIDLYVNNVLLTASGLTANTNDTIKIVARKGYVLSPTGNSYFSTMTYTTIPFTMNSNNTIGTLKVLDGFSSEYNFRFASEVAPPSPLMRLTTKTLNRAIGANIDVFVKDVQLTESGLDVYENDVIKIVAKTGYDLADGNNFFNSNTLSVVNFAIDETKNIGTLTVTNNITREPDFNFQTTAEPVVIPPNDNNPIDNLKRGVNNVYLLDKVKAREIMGKAFQRSDSNGGVKDMSEYILNLINIPFEVNSSYVIADSNVKIVDFDTGILGTELNTDLLIINMGFIEVPKINNDLSDFENVQVMLHLPYGNEIELIASDVIGYKINIYYWLDVYTGKATINVYSTKTEELIASQKIDLGVNVPFNKTFGKNPSNNEFNSIKETGYNGVNTAYVEVKQYELILKDGFFTNPIIDESVLTDVKGYIDVENIQLNVNATLQEKSDILNLLRQGVIIK